MELAGLNIVMQADFSQIYAEFTRFDSMAEASTLRVQSLFAEFSRFNSQSNSSSTVSSGLDTLTQSVNALSQAQNVLTSSAIILNDEWRNEAGNLSELISQNEQYRNELNAVKTALKEDLAARTSANGSIRDASARTIELTQRQEELKIAMAANSQIIRAQVKEMQAAGGSMDEMSHMLGQMRDTYRQLGAAERDSPFGRQLADQIRQVDAEIKRLDASIGNSQRNVGNYGSAVSGAFSQTFSRTVHAGTEALLGMQRGVNALAIDLPNLIEQFRHMAQQQSAIRASGGDALTTWQLMAAAFNPLTIAIQLGIMTLVKHGDKLVDFAKNLMLGSEAAIMAAKNIENLKKVTTEATESAVKNAAKESSNAEILYKATQNVSLSYQERKYAADELIKIAPQIFKGLSDEAIVAGQATLAYEKLSNAIKDKIALEVGQDQAKELFIQKEAAEKLFNVMKGSSAITQKFTSDYNALQSQMQKGTITTSEYDKSFSKLNATYANSMSKFKKDNVLKDFPFFSRKGQEAAIDEYVQTVSRFDKKTTELSGIRGRLDKLFAGADKKPKVIKPPKVHDDSESIQHAQDKISKAYKNYIDTTKKAGDEIESLDPYKKVAETIRIEGGIIQTFLDDQNSATARQLAIEADLYLDNSKKIQRVLSAKSQFIKEFAEDARKAIADTIAGAANALGEGIGNLIAGSGGVADIFKGIVTSIADQVISFGKYLTQWGATILAAQIAIQSLGSNPYLAIAAGIALVAVGSAAKAALSDKQKKVGKGGAFAAGGLIYQPTMALMGEYNNARSNPEVVAPLDKLKTILKQSGGGNQTQVFIPEITIKGQDLLLSLKRADKSFNR